jgi:serine/threonine protein phosphatase PrpC
MSVLISAFTTIGMREYQEDIVIRHIFAKPFQHLVLCGVLDGHGGSKCAKFTEKNILRYLTESLEKKAEQNIMSPNLEILLKAAVENTIQEWDDFCLGKGVRQTILNDEDRINYFNGIDMKKYIEQEKDSGTTLCLGIYNIEKKTMDIINIGDSRCTWKIGNNISQTLDHGVPSKNPHIDGFDVQYINGRVHDDLAMSSSIGDNTAALVGSVLRQPDTYHIKVTTGLFIFATDGLFDIVTTQDLFLEPKQTVDEIVGSHLFDDNTSIVMIYDK